MTMSKITLNFQESILCFRNWVHNINVREYRRGKQEWTRDKDKQNKWHSTEKDEQHEPHQKLGVNPWAHEG